MNNSPISDYACMTGVLNTDGSWQSVTLVPRDNKTSQVEGWEKVLATLFGVTQESKSKVLETTAQEDLEAQQAMEQAEDLEPLPIGGMGQAFIQQNPSRFSEFYAGPKKLDMKPVDKLLKKLTMKPMKKLHFVTAILNRIQNFHSTDTNFSAHDVTRSLREAVAAGEIELLDVQEYDDFNGQCLPVILHDKVKEVVRELFDNSYIPDYVPDYDPSRPYVLYVKTVAPDIDSDTVFGSLVAGTVPSTLPVVQDLNGGNSGLSVADSTSNQVFVEPLKAINSEMWQKAETYLRNRGYAATAKQIQSRLKGYSVTCEELVKGLADRGWSVNPASHVSQSSIGSD